MYRFLAILIIGLASDALAGVPDALEVRYSEAVIAYQSGQGTQALAILAELIAKAPQVPEFYELKALALKGAGRDFDAARVYGDVIHLKQKLGRSNQELAPYYFELGVLMFKAGKGSLSSQYLAFSLKQHFNEGPSQMYLGMNAFKDENLELAEAYFAKAAKSEIRDLVPSANLYLGQTYLKGSYSIGASQKFLEARDQSQAILNDPDAGEESKKLAQQTLTAAEQALAPYRVSRFFGTLATSSGYDSNALTVPSTSQTASEVAGKSTMTQTLSAGVGYMTSALSDWQWVPSYRGSMNYNFNRKAGSTEFVTHTLALYLTHEPLAVTSYGVKAEGNLAFRNEIDTSTYQGTYKVYTTSLSVGPYIKKEIRRKWVVGADLTLDPIQYHQDIYATSEYKRTGTGYSASVYVQNERGTRFINPYFSFRYTSDNSSGVEYRSNAFKFSLSNAMHLNSRLDLTSVATYGTTNYSERSSGARFDRLMDFMLQGSYRAKPRWTILASSGFSKNLSTVPATYSYNRFVISVGVSYSLF